MSLRRLALVAYTLSAGATVRGEALQPSGLSVPSNYSSQLDTVKQIFNVSYTAYQQYAFGHDELLPVSESYTDYLFGWGATIADGLDTMWIMGFTDWFEEGVNQLASVDFNSAATDGINVFDGTIRYIAGLLSAYELSNQSYPVLLQKAQDIGNNLAYAWVDGNAMPYNGLNLDHSVQVGTTNVAQVGTLTLEFERLSHYTGNDTYRQLAEKAALAVTALADPIPGIPGQSLWPNGSYVSDYVTWGGGTDSYLEYLIKYPRLTNTNDTTFADTWATAVDSSIQQLLRTSTVGNFLYLADFDGSDIRHISGHLNCFYGGNWILGGKMLNNDTIVNYGLQLTDACFNTYRGTATGIGPEGFAWISSDGNYTGSSISADQLTFYNEHGYYITSTDYIQRPEVLESNFYAWRVTGDTKYLDNAVFAMDAFQKYLPSNAGYAGIYDVTSTSSEQYDDQEAFWFAEVLKYLYLTFDDPSNISLDDYVFNTECHPFKAPAALSQYGSGKLKAPSSQPVQTVAGPAPMVSGKPSVLSLLGL